MASVGDISVTIGLDVAEFQKGLSRAESSLKKAGSSFSSIGESMAKAITIPLSAIGVGAMASAVMVGDSQSLIQAQLGVTSDEAKSLQGVVNNIFKDGLGGDMAEVQNSVTTVVRQMKSLEGASNEMVEKVARNTLNLSKAFDTDSKEVSKAVNAMQAVFTGLDADTAFDNITKGFQNGLDYSGEFLDTINEYSVHFQKMGFSADEMFGVFNAGAEAGVFQLDKVGDLVKEMNIRFSDNTAGQYMDNLSAKTQNLYKEYQKTGKGGREVFQSIMGDLAGMDDKQKAYTIGVGLMGTQFEDLDMKAVSAIANVRGGLDGAKGSTDALNESVNSGFGTTLTSAFRNVQVALQPLGQELANLVQKYLPPVIEKIEQAGTWFAGLSDKSQLLVIALGGIGAVFPILLMGIGSMIGAIGSIAGAFSTAISVVSNVSKVFSSLKTAMNFTKILPLVTSPVGLIIIAIGALIAIGVLIWKNWDEIKAKAIEIWGAISDFFSETWSKISSGISDFLKKIGDWFSEKWDSISKKTSEVFDAIVDFLAKWGKRIFDSTPIGMFVNLIVDNWDFIKKTTQIVFDMVVAILKAIFNKIVEVVKPIVKILVDFLSNSWESIKSTTSTVFNYVKDFLVNIWNSIVNFIKPIATAIFDAVKNAWEKLKSTTIAIYDSVKEKVTSVFDSMKEKVTDVAGKILNTAKEKFDSVKSAITEPIEDAKDKIKSALDKITGFFSNLNWKFPKPKMPHFSVSRGEKEFMGATIPVPVFDISWNAKGNIFNGASILGGGQGVGEAGAEVVMPIQHKRYMKPFASSIASHLKDMSKGKSEHGGITQNITVNSPEPLSPSDVARKTLQASRRLAMEWG